MNYKFLSLIGGLRERLTWSNSTFLIKSPLVRIAATVPLLGYVILYGDAFSEIEFFSFTDRLGADGFLFDSQTKVRMLYYGGLCILISFLIYLAACPRMCKRLASVEEARDEGSRALEPEYIRSLYSKGYLLFFNPDHSPAVIEYVRELAFELIDDLVNALDTSDLKDIAEYNGNKYTQFEQNGECEGKLRSYVRIIFKTAAKMNSDGQTEAEILEHAGMSLVEPYLAKYIDAPRVRTRCISIFVAAYVHVNQRRKPFALLVLLTSVTGLALTVLPSLDVLLQVLSVDLGFAH